MILSITDLCCGYGGSSVVQNFSATIRSGEVFCLLGPNGIGKTTLFKTILGLIPPLSGKVLVDDHNFLSLPRKKRAKYIGYVPQAHVPPFSYSVLDVVVMGRIAHMGIMGKPSAKDWKKAEEALGILGVGHLASRVYTRLSGGERQMTLIARALAQEPKFLMMDEPTANLDFGNIARVLDTVLSLAQKGMAVIMTTHAPDQVFRCNASVALLRKGRQGIVGAAEAVLTEENLTDAYSVPVAVEDVVCKDGCFKLVQALPSNIKVEERA